MACFGDRSGPVFLLYEGFDPLIAGTGCCCAAGQPGRARPGHPPGRRLAAA